MQPLKAPKYAKSAVSSIGCAPNALPASRNVPTNATMCALREENIKVVRKYAVAKNGTGARPKSWIISEMRWPRKADAPASES